MPYIYTVHIAAALLMRGVCCAETAVAIGVAAEPARGVRRRSSRAPPTTAHSQLPVALRLLQGVQNAAHSANQPLVQARSAMEAAFSIDMESQPVFLRNLATIALRPGLEAAAASNAADLCRKHMLPELGAAFTRCNNVSQLLDTILVSYSISEAQQAGGAAEFLRSLAAAAPKRVCCATFSRGDVIWKCKTCAVGDDTCVVCQECFQDADHTGHDVFFWISRHTDGGCCDCGDESAWSPAGRPRPESVLLVLARGKRFVLCVLPSPLPSPSAGAHPFLPASLADSLTVICPPPTSLSTVCPSSIVLPPLSCSLLSPSLPLPFSSISLATRPCTLPAWISISQIQLLYVKLTRSRPISQRISMLYDGHSQVCGHVHEDSRERRPAR
eukprot:1005721-Pleurochrysis_carterae.AAC.2